MSDPSSGALPSPPLHVETPLIHSHPLASCLPGDDAQVWLKLENTQPTATFKIRGLGLLAQEHRARGATRLVSSSGGNAGLAAAYAGARLGMPVTVLVPSTTPAAMRALLEREGAAVRVVGEVWDEADAEARALASADEVGYLSPFDHPTIWRGHASMIREVRAQLATQAPRSASDGVVPDSVVCAVGGGGLLCGVLEGLHAVGWQDVPVLAVETEGAASYHAARAAGAPVDIGAITSVAKSLGARRVADEAVAWLERHPIDNLVVTDEQALHACRRFADDHRFLVEPACGAALAAVYEGSDALRQARRVLVVVCGGASVKVGALDF